MPWYDPWVYGTRFHKSNLWWVDGWNWRKEVRSTMNLPEKIIVKDDTIREGHETPGAKLSLDEKVELAKLLDETGIPEAEIGYAAGIKEDAEAFKAIKAENLKLKLSSHARMYAPDIKKEVDDIISVGADHLNFLLVPNPELKTKKFTLERIREGISYAKDQGVSVAFGTGRIGPRYWKIFSEIAIGAGVDRIVVYDGNGCMGPTAFKDCIKYVKSLVGTIPIEVHTHQDLGLATATTLAAIEGGAEVVDVIINGLGDRAGNASLEEVILACEMLYEVPTGVKLEKLYDLCKTVERMMGVPIQPNKAVCGRNCFIHESDLHVEQLLAGS